MSPRTIVLLSARRTGAGALAGAFQNHPDVRIAHVNPRLVGWEPNFWNLAADALEADPEPFRHRFLKSHPYLGGSAPSTALEAFELWDQVLDELGPIVFDHSSGYLRSRRSIALLMQYAQSHDVRVFGLIRDARDAIASQLSREAGRIEGDSPAFREKVWLDQYDRLETLGRSGGIPIWRYEDIVARPDHVVPEIFDYCGLTPRPATWAHLRPTNIGRHAHPQQGWWKPSARLSDHLSRFGYTASSSARAA